MSWPATATEMSTALKDKSISSAQLLEHSYELIDHSDADIRAFISLADREELLRTARAIDNRRARGDQLAPYAGVPIAVKDNIAVRGLRLTCGSRILENYFVQYNATVVDKLHAAGLLIIGKTNMDEFGFGSTTENSAFFTTHNPRALDRVPGGTSGGSAAAVAAGFVPWALGTDTGGSVRQPAALCGISGLRPTYGRVSRYGVVAFASSMDQVGPMSQTVGDTKSLFAIIAGHDERDSTSLADDFHASHQTHAPLRIGIPQEYLSAECQSEIVQAVEDVKVLAAELGWEVYDISLPYTEYALSAYYIISSVEAASNLARYDGVKYGYAEPHAADWNELAVRSRSHGFGTEAKRRIILGAYASSAGYADQYYNKACITRSVIRNDFQQAFDTVDLIVSPVSPSTAWPIGERLDDPMKMYLSDIYSIPVALAGIPSMVLPVGEDLDGLPIGLQLTGASGSEPLILQAARDLEEALAKRGT